MSGAEPETEERRARGVAPGPGSASEDRADAPRVVTWQRLELRGFGIHDDLCVSFAPGLCTLVAPNEFGKSTLVAGLAAVLFGLPHVSDPTKFGRERFRSWGNPPRFEGAVTFSARDGRAYELHRNFETHEVRLVRLDEDGAEQIFDGAHNPIARTGTDAFERHLDRLIGLADREAFRQSFHVAQPLPPPEELGAEVQRLLSGSGQGTFQSGLARLADMIGERTVATGALGVSSRNLVKDRRLETLNAEILDLETRLREGRRAADRVQELDEELAELEAEHGRWSSESRQREAAARSCKAWLDAKDDHARRTEHHRNLKRALETARRLSGQADEAAREIRESWPEFAGAPPERHAELHAAITAARDAEAALAGREAAAAAAAEDLGRDEKVEAEAAARLEAHRAEEPEGALVFRAEDLRDLRAQADRARRDWHAYVAREEDLALRQEDLARFASIEAADEPTRQLLRDYRYELEQRRRDAEAERRAAEDARAARASRAAERRRPRRPSVTPRRLAVAALAALVVGGIVGVWTDGMLFAALAAVLAGAAGFAGTPGRDADAVPSVPAGDAAASGADGPRADAAGSDATRTPDATPAQHALDVFLAATRPFVETFHAYDDPSAAVRDWEESSRALAAERRLQDEHVRRVWGGTPADVPTLDPAALDGAWGELARYARSEGWTSNGVGALVAWLERRDHEAWSRAIEGAAAAEEARAAWRRQEADLDRRAAAAQAAAEKAREAHAAAADLLEEARGDDAAARAAIEPLLEATGASAAELLARWKAYREALRARDGIESNLAALLEGRDAKTIEDLERAEYDAGMSVMRVVDKVDALRAEHPELPPLDAAREEVAERWRAHEKARADAAAELEETEKAIFERTKSHSRLTAADHVNVAAAEIELAELKRERDALTEEIDALVIAHRELQAAITGFQANYRERLERTATEYMVAFSAVDGRRVQLGEDFEVRVREPDGTRVHPSQLSQGAQDQLLLALRLAIADHLSDDAPLPLILDDPFLNWDDVRLEQVRDVLRDLARDRQVILLSHRDAFADWGERAVVGAR